MFFTYCRGSGSELGTVDVVVEKIRHAIIWSVTVSWSASTPNTLVDKYSLYQSGNYSARSHARRCFWETVNQQPPISGMGLLEDKLIDLSILNLVISDVLE